ncbi:MAG: short-chain dehydrogenase [Candidatus Marinimicrobia bacterium]|nr:short-chain dehydrogenase [Candidatus Neomarinimicrobiota bacterium]
MLPDKTFKDKVILITGGGTGLGKSIGEYILKLGGTIIITSRREEVIEEAANSLNASYPNSVLGIAGDVRKIEDVENVINKSIKKFGHVDMLINNAAGNFISPTERLSPNAFSTIIDIVLKGTCNYTLTLGKIWIKDKQPGTILNIATTYALTGSGYVVPSAAAKGGVLTFTKSIAAEWAKYKIRCNAVAPGPFPTEGAWSRLVPPGFSKFFDIKKRIPLKRVGEHQELANICAYLLSDYSAYITGEIITIDGGEWMYNAGQFSWLDKIPSAMWSIIEKTIRKKSK